MKTLTSAIFFIIMMVSLGSQAQFQAFAFLDSISLENQNHIMASYKTFAAKLPPAWINKLPIKIGLLALSKDKYGKLDSLCGSDGQLVFGQSQALLGYTKKIDGMSLYKGDVIYIHEDLLRGQATGACSARQIILLFNRTLVHEMSHIYDFNKSKINDAACDAMALSQPYACLRQAQVSDNLQFLFLAGFKPTLKSDVVPGRNPDITHDVLHVERMNMFTDRSPRSYEYTNQAEYFAVNMELFVFDGDYQCRRPALYSFLSHHFNFSPYAQRPCENATTVININNQILKLNPAKIFAIHYLQNTPGKKVQSWWGHALLRLIVCAPERTEVSSACLNDTKYHIVVDFAAQLFDEKLSLIGGLTGKYPSALSFTNFNEFRSNIIIAEQKDVRSYPLELTRDQIKMLVQTLAEKSWSQVTQYLFLQNNCSTQVLFTLLSALSSERLEIEKLKTDQKIFSPDFILTPAGVVNVLAYLKLIDLQKFKATEGVTYFSSPNSNILKRQKNIDPLMSLKLSDLSQLSAAVRSQNYQRIFSKNRTSTEKNNLVAAFVEIEQISLAKTNDTILKFWSEVHKNLLKRKVLQPRSFKDSLTAGNLAWDGYGVPLNLENIYVELIKRYKEQSKSQLTVIVNSLDEKQKQQVQALVQEQEQIKKNATFLVLQNVEE